MTSSASARILMLLENSPYPQDGRVRREATTLTEVGYSVTVIAQRARGQVRTEIVDGVRVYRYPAIQERAGFVGYLMEYGYSMLAAWCLTAWVFLRGGFDVIHAHNPPDTYVFVAAPYKLMGKRFVFDHHDLSPEMYEANFGEKARPSVSRLLRLCERLTFRMADRVISTNESYREIALNRGAVPSDVVTVVRNGPDLDRVRSAEIDPELRNKARTIIGFLGEIGPQDGVEHLVRALAHLVNDGYDDVFCVAIGAGSELSNVKDLANELGVDARIWFAGYVPFDDEVLMRYMSTADICVEPAPSSPVNDRSTMIKMTEYMALAKPSVAFDLPEHRYTAGDAALYAAPNDERELARRIAELIDDPARGMELGARGRRRVENEMAWTHQRQSLLDIYAGLTG